MIKQSSEVIGELFEGVFLRFIGFVGLTVTQHVWGYDAVTSLDPRTDLMFPTSPDRRCMVSELNVSHKRGGVPEIREPVD